MNNNRTNGGADTDGFTKGKNSTGEQTPANDEEWAEALAQSNAPRTRQPGVDFMVQTPQTDEEWEHAQNEVAEPIVPADADAVNEQDVEKEDVVDMEEPKEEEPQSKETKFRDIVVVNIESEKEDSSPPIVDLDSSALDYEYDREELLTTKVIKVLKKRPNIKPLQDDSDDYSDIVIKDTVHQSRLSASTAFTYDSVIPRSDFSGPVSTESSSIMFTSSESLNLHTSDADSILPSVQEPGASLGSGMAFIYMVIPPDGGYGYIVLVLSFIAQLIVDGIIFSVGILLPYIRSDFEVDNSLVVLIASVQIGCYFTGGAFSSALINGYGFRPVACIGVLISIGALTAASFSRNLLEMLLLYSAIGGVALSMIWASSQLIIGFYFERYRPIANGFACSGAGAGIVIFFVMNSLLVPVIGWRYTIRVEVLLLVMVVFVALAYLEVAPTAIGYMQKHTGQASTSSDEYYGNFYVHNFLRDDQPVGKSRSHVIEYYEPKRKGTVSRSIKRWKFCFRRKKDRVESVESTTSTLKDKRYVIKADPIQREDLFYTGPADYDDPHSRETLDGKEIELTGSQKHMQSAAYGMHHIQDYEPVAPESPKSFFTRGDSAQSDSRKKTKKKPSSFRVKMARALNRLFDFHLFKIFEFRLLVLAAFLYPLGFNIPFVYSKARTTIPIEYASLIGPSIGAANFIMRIVCGFVAFKMRTWTSFLCGSGLVFGGLAVFCSAFYGHNLIWFQFLYGLCYGVAPAVYTLRTLIFVRYLGLSKLTNAFGITALAMGLGVFIGTSVAGVMVELTGGYTVAFACAGICLMSAGMINLFLPSIVKYRNARASP